MISKQFTRDNHYVPRIYLKQWASEDGRLWNYRILVSNNNVPMWKLSSIKGIAYHEHLYTRIIAGGETDEIERWLDRKFEAPAECAIQKVVSENRLSPDDWELLVRFLAAQDVRTPGRLAESLERWNETLPDLIQTTLEDAVHELEEAKRENRPVRQSRTPNTELMPMRILTERNPKSETATIRAESVVGRGLWLYSLKHLLTNTVNYLLRHKWTILKSPMGVDWNTSDDPVIKLNYHHPEKYDFKGGWDSKGTEILLPISPSHLLYTKVGEKPPRRGTIVQDKIAKGFQRFTAEHAHRFIFALKIDSDVARTRPRTVNRFLFKEEAEQWKRWHDENTIVERNLMNE